MPYFGDIFIPWLTTKDTSISRDVIEKNFVDAPPQVFELNNNLESGTYSAILNEDVHKKNESFSEQTDAINSMPGRHVSEFPYAVGGDKGHIVVENSTVEITPSNVIRRAELDIRFLSSDKFKPAASVEASEASSDFTVTPIESVYPIPADATVSKNPEVTVSTRDGDVDFYKYSTRENISWTLPSDYASVERVSPTRLYKSNDERVYSDLPAVENNSYFDNGLLKATLKDPTDISYYDGSWVKVGDIDVQGGSGYASEYSNDETEVSFASNSYYYSIYRGLPVVEVNISDSSLTFTSTENITSADTSNLYYSTATMDSSGYELILIRESSDGSISVNSDNITLSGLDSTNEYTIYVGVVPSEMNSENLARWVFNRGSWRRTMVQK